MKASLLACLLAIALAPTAAQAARPAPAAVAAPCTTATSLPAASATFTVGTLRVQRYGDHGRPVILIPGLGSGSWVWAGTVRHLMGEHVVYALTLAGFDGVAPPARKTGLIDQADASLLKLITDRRIQRPVLVGHSLGGTLAIRFAGEHSDLIAGVVAVDGLPVFPGTQDLPAAERASRAAKFKAYMAATTATPAQFAAQQLSYMQVMGVIDPALAACTGKLQARSDAASVVEYGAEDYAADYRPGLKHVAVPLMEVSPYNAPDFEAAAKRSGQPLMSAGDKATYYGALLAGAAGAKVVTIEPARHFVMLDQPLKFNAVLDRFLAALPKVPAHD